MKPYIICHMMPSLDGRLRTDRWNIPDAAHEEYDRTADTYRAQAWLCGRVTMEEFANGRWRCPASRRKVRVGSGDWIAPHRAARLAVVLDSAGKLAWKENEVEGDALVIVMTEAAPSAYRAYLRDKEISYVVAGGRDGKINLAATVRTLAEKFGVKRLLVEGG